MNKINHNNMYSEQMKNEDKLGSYLKSLPVEVPSSNFAVSVMAQIRHESKPSSEIYKPLISKNFWRLLLFLVGVAIVSILLSGGSFSGSDVAATRSLMTFFEARPVVTFMSSMSGVFKQIPLPFFLGMLSVALLLFIDQLYFRIKTASL